MATSQRTDRALTEPGPAVDWLTERSPPPFLFTVRILEQLTRDAPRIGGDGPLSEERIYFRHTPSFGMQPREVDGVVWTRVATNIESMLEPPRRRFEVTTAILGLSGADSPMPLYLAEDLLLDTDEAEAARGFLDIVHNRLTALFYRSLSKLQYTREYTSDGADPGSLRLIALAGQDAHTDDTRGGIDRNDWLRMVSLIASGPATPRSVRNALAVAIREYADSAPVRIEQFTGQWVRFDPSQTNRLGNRNHEAARTFIIGTRIRHPAHEARITIGPIFPATAALLAPNGDGFDRIAAVVGAMAPAAVQYELELLVEEAALPPFLLGRRRLARDVCLVARPAQSRVVSRRYPLST